MIIILKGADFSANNIGQVPIERELSELTTMSLSKYTKQLSMAQKNAVDDFLNTLDTSGILGKMTSLWLPILAGQLAEASINIASADMTADCTFNSECMELYAGGLRNLGLEDASVTSSGAKIKASSLCSNNFHFAWYPLSTMGEYHLSTDKTTSYDWAAFYTAQATTFLRPGRFLSDSKVALTAGGWRVLNSNGLLNTGDWQYVVWTQEPTLKLFNFTPALVSSGEMYGFSPEKQVMSNVAGLDTSIGTWGQAFGEDFFVTGYKSSALRAPHGIISCGEGLTDEEIAIYGTAASLLIAAFS